MKLKQISFQILVVFYDCEINLNLKKWQVKVKKKSTTRWYSMYYDWHHNNTQWNEILVVGAFIWSIIMLQLFHKISIKHSYNLIMKLDKMSLKT